MPPLIHYQTDKLKNLDLASRGEGVRPMGVPRSILLVGLPVLLAAGWNSSAGAADRRVLLRQAGELRRIGRYGPSARNPAVPESLCQACRSTEALLRRGAAQGLAWWPDPERAIPLLQHLNAQWHETRWRSPDARGGRYVTRAALGIQRARQVGLGDLDRAMAAFLSSCGTERAMLQRAAQDAGLLRMRHELEIYLQGIAVLLAEARDQGTPSDVVARVRGQYRFDLVPAAKLRLELTGLSSSERVRRLFARLAQAKMSTEEPMLAAQALADEALRNNDVLRLADQQLKKYVSTASAHDLWPTPDGYMRRHAGLTADALRAGQPFPVVMDYL
ncbi:MAG: hypothetical protein HYU66_24380 [Armatimonadetes bacterium]|nr:hypothetical protein [Armatimonadota bacterium]